MTMPVVCTYLLAHIIYMFNFDSNLAGSNKFRKFLVFGVLCFAVLAGIIAISLFSQSKNSTSSSNKLARSVSANEIRDALRKTENPDYVKSVTEGDKISDQEAKNYVKLVASESTKSKYDKKTLEDKTANLIKDNQNNGRYNSNFSQGYITPENGGSLIAGNISVNFPAGALDAPVIVTFKNTGSLKTAQITEDLKTSAIDKLTFLTTQAKNGNK